MKAFLHFFQSKKSIVLCCFPILLLVISTGCQKSIDFKNKDADVLGTPLPGQGTYCRIESIWEKDHGGRGEQRFILILYDEYENPVAITVPRIGTGTTYRTFRYDSWHRLREYIGSYGNGGFQFWHQYGYDQSGRIGYDTVYILGGIVNDQPGPSFEKRTSEIEYDNHNRISRVTTHSSFGGTSVSNYGYDAAGNLIRPGVTYDSKTNFQRTNDIWMFLARDYSMNNPVVAEQYNAAGYPTKINVDAPNWVSFADTEIYMHKSEISYTCRPSPWW